MEHCSRRESRWEWQIDRKLSEVLPWLSQGRSHTRRYEWSPCCE